MTDQLLVDAATPIVSLTLYDMQGRVLCTANTDRMDVSHLPNGIYILRVVDNSGKIGSIQVVK